MKTDRHAAGTGPTPPPPRPALNRSRIAAAALALIDVNGLRAFSMRKLGAGLGVDPMAAYRYFEDQDALFDGVAELLFAEADLESLPWEESWRTVAGEYCLRLRATLLDHPHAVAVFATHPVRSRAAADVCARLTGHLAAAGFDPSQAAHVARCLREFTVGHALSVAVRHPEPEGADEDAAARFETGLTAMLDGFERLR
ncbi:TetR/AcrR family transcriptional regulator C-terminal domain-containing protein [Streptomyces sp. NPDC005496]|uniref:TetR/AcrR family transcriptional regulator C-terminal domain-containing protein n=1 Tax=unclassified Streptomyces TaxID=2593676 RepID=UPI0033AE8019